jgi:hypothetical protein
MSTANMSDPNVMIGAPVHSTDGEKLGKIASVYFDNETNQPAWAAVKTGIVGGHVSLVPLGQGRWGGNALTVPCDKAALNDAPHHDPDAAITTTDEEYLYRHYGLCSTCPAHREQVGSPGGDSPRSHGRARHVEREPITDANRGEAMTSPGLSEEEDELTLTEERAKVHKETVPVERVRLATETVTEQHQVDETVRKEQIETEGIDPGLRNPNEN